MHAVRVCMCMHKSLHTHALTHILTHDSKRPRGRAKAASRYPFDDLSADNGVTNGTSFFSHSPSLPLHPHCPRARARALSLSLPCLPPTRPLAHTLSVSLLSHSLPMTQDAGLGGEAGRESVAQPLGAETKKPTPAPHASRVLQPLPTPDPNRRSEKLTSVFV